MLITAFQTLGRILLKNRYIKKGTLKFSIRFLKLTSCLSWFSPATEAESIISVITTPGYGGCGCWKEQTIMLQTYHAGQQNHFYCIPDHRHPVSWFHRHRQASAKITFSVFLTYLCKFTINFQHENPLRYTDCSATTKDFHTVLFILCFVRPNFYFVIVSVCFR